MYRVELKGSLQLKPSNHPTVPNVPCGVESILLVPMLLELLGLVPNVPCGVESSMALRQSLIKDLVPNVPCGVERRETAGLLWSVPLCS